MWTTPSSRRTELYSAFLQADTTLIKDYLFLSAGVNLGHNDYTGYEFQPSLQLSWQPFSRQTLWLSFAKSVKTPTRLESDMYLGIVSNRTEQNVTYFRFYGNPDLDSETIYSTEAGYRFRPSDSFFLDVSVYCNDYDDIIYLELGEFKQSFSEYENRIEYEWPFHMTNDLKARAFGGEITLDWQLLGWWKIKAYYAYLSFELDLSKIDDLFLYYFNISDENPKHEISLQSWMDVSQRLELNTRVRYIDEVPLDNHKNNFILDVQVRWKISDCLDMFVLCKNLTDSKAVFVSKDYFEAPDIRERSIYGKIEYRFK